MSDEHTGFTAHSSTSVQTTPDPFHPVLHEHVKLPNVLKHDATDLAQLWVPMLHSSTSTQPALP